MPPDPAQNQPNHIAPAAAHEHTPRAVAADGQRSDSAAWTRFEWFCAALTGIVPFVVYAFSASASPYWLDSGEFTAAAGELDIAHPPGHPLAALWGGLFALLPLGPLPYRVALGQGVAAAFGLVALSRAMVHTLGSLSLRREIVAGIGAAVALWFGASYACWFQAIRAEVYTLQMMLLCIAFERLAYACEGIRAHAARERPLYAAAFALGLGLTNHHLIAFLAIPAMLVPWWSDGSMCGVARRTLGCMASALVALSLYVYLPLRAEQSLRMNLGTPRDWARFWWVVSARVYARHMGTGETEPMSTRLFDLLVILIEQLTLPVLLLAILGTYAGLRRADTTRLTLTWCIVFAVNLGVRAWLGPIRSNPDMLGYMLPGMAALSALAAFGFAALLESIQRALHTRALPAWCTLIFPLAVLPRYALAYPRTTLAHFEVSDALAELRLRTLPPRALVVLVSPQALFLHWAYEASEGLRADVSVVPVPFLAYPGVADAVIARDPDLRELITSYLRDGALARDALTALARERPVQLELDASETRALYDITLPDTGYARVVADVPSPVALAAADYAGSAALRVLQAHSTDANADETRSQSLWLAYVTALRLAAGGAVSEARAHVAHARAQNPLSAELAAFENALANASGPLDIRAFLPRASGSLAR